LRPNLPTFLGALLAVLAILDGLLLASGPHRLDGGAFFGVGLLGACLMTGACFYRVTRPDPRLAAMLFGAGFLCLFSCEASTLNYLLLPHAGGRIDVMLARWDRALGFDWPAALRWMARHPVLNGFAFIAYSSMLPQVAMSAIVLAAIEPARVYRASMALALSALICIAVWVLAPSFGAFSVYASPDAHLTLALDSGYARELERLLRDGPGLISPRDAKGLIGFPSYHAAMALLVIWYSRDVKFLRWPVAALNLAVLVATPVQGGHHAVDVLAAFPVAAFSILLTSILARGEIFSSMVNNPSKAGKPAVAAAE
jgi:hypothetical protein